MLMPNARYELLPKAGARNERTLEAVSCQALILIEAPSSAYRRGMLALGKQQPQEEETS
jgi:hypothetical protein